LPVKPLLVFFALFTASAAVLMLSGWRPQRGEMSSRDRVALGLASGSGLGLVAGMIGRGGGSFVVPLLYIVGLDAKTAAATSAAVVTGSGISSFVFHLATTAQPRWGVWVACVIAVLSGSQLGSRLMAERMKSQAVKRVFGWVLLGIAALITFKDVLGQQHRRRGKNQMSKCRIRFICWLLLASISVAGAIVTDLALGAVSLIMNPATDSGSADLKRTDEAICMKAKVSDKLVTPNRTQDCLFIQSSERLMA
jgi:hypothetical protein